MDNNLKAHLLCIAKLTLCKLLKGICNSWEFKSQVIFEFLHPPRKLFSSASKPSSNCRAEGGLPKDRFPLFSVDGCVSVALWGTASVVLTQALSSCKTQTWELCNLSSRAFYVDFIAILCNQNTMTCIACGILYLLRCTWDKVFPLL